MKVKEFNTYRAPKRRPWGAIVVLLLLVAGGYYWFFVRDPKPKPDVVEKELDAAEGAGVMEEAITSDDSGAQNESSGLPPASPQAVAALMQEASGHEAADRLEVARDLYKRALVQAGGDDALRSEVEAALGRVHIALLISPRRMREKEDYVVQRGDSLGAIANRYGTTVSLIQKSNMLANPNLIKVGDRLRVFTGSFELIADKTKRDMVVLMNGEFFKRYRVGTGLYGRTPVGTFVIRDKIVEPSWWPPDGREVPFGDPDNILGTRWLSLRATGETPDVRGYGIHGTWDPDSVGKALSAGCLRMVNEEVEELFIYIPAGTPVRIVE